MLLEGRQALDFGIAQGRRSAGLSLTPEQYQKLKIWISKSDRFDLLRLLPRPISTT